MIGLVTTTAAGRRAASELEHLQAQSYDVRELSKAWAECDQLVVFLATGATVRLIAPLLQDKHTDPGVVCVDEARQFAVALVGGHGGGANELAQQVAEELGCEPINTADTDAHNIPEQDTRHSKMWVDVAGVHTATLDGERD